MKNQTEKAIEAYLEILEGLEGTPELEDELPLFNKVGDLQVKAGKVQAAVEMWERGVGRYAEGGFHNNAIALCNKILRNAPGRTHIYLKLAQLMVQRGFVAEAKQNLLEYAERMKKSGQLDQAFNALKEFADLSPNNEEIRLLLAEQLKAAARTDEAREQLAKLYHETKAHGDERRSRATVEKMKAIDPEYDVETAPKPKVKERQAKSSDLVFLDLGDSGPSAPPSAPPPFRAPAAGPPPRPKPPAASPPPKAPPPPEPEPEPEPLVVEPTSLVEPPEPEESEQDLPIERGSVEFDSRDVDAGTLSGLTGSHFDLPDEPAPLDFEPTVLGEPRAGTEDPFGQDLNMLDLSEDEPQPASGAGVLEDALEVPDLDLGGFGDAAALAAPELSLGGEREAVETIDLTIDLEPLAAETMVGPPDVTALEARVADDPDDPQAHQTLGEALIETGERERGLEELDIALGQYEGKEQWERAQAMADEIIRLDPNSVRHHQKQVEYAFRSQDKGQLIEAYLGLSDALMRSGAMDRARAVYQRVLEHDPKNARALSAVAALEPPPAAPAAPVAKKAPVTEPGDFVDLGALVLGDDRPKDTRLRIQDEEPTGDEQRDFDEMLAQFKKGIDASLGVDDVQAHYDLGVAFKEMGLVDEAIGEFQKALRGSEGRLRTSEALGTCFFDKGQFNVASTVLRRAVDTDPAGDEEKIGLLYWLGRSEEEMGRPADALGYYQRVFAVDIGFQDVSGRVKSLARAGR